MEAYLYRKGVSKDLWGKRVGSDSLSSCETEYMGLTLAAQEASLGGGWTLLDVFDDDPPQIEGVMLASLEWSYLSDLRDEAYAIGGVARVQCMVVESVDPTLLGVKRKLIAMHEYG